MIKQRLIRICTAAIITVLAAVLIFVSHGNDSFMMPALSSGNPTVIDSMYIIYNEQKIPIGTSSLTIEDTENGIIVYLVIPDVLPVDPVICVVTEGRALSCYLGETLIYKQGAMGGSAYVKIKNYINIPSGSRGNTLELNYGSSEHGELIIAPALLGSRSDMINNLYAEQGWQFVSAFGVLLIAVFMLLLALYNSVRYPNYDISTVMTFCFLTAIISVWIISNLQLSVMIFPGFSSELYKLSYVSFLTVPLAVTAAYKALISKFMKLFNRLIFIQEIIIIVMLILDISNLLDISEIIFITLLMMAFAVISSAAAALTAIIKDKNKTAILSFAASAIIASAAGIIFASYYIIDINLMENGIYTILMTSFILILSLAAAKKNSDLVNSAANTSQLDTKSGSIKHF